MSAWLAILGINEDGVEGLGAIARQRLASARLVVGGARHLALAAPLITGETLAWPRPMDAAYPAILARRGEPVVVLASGDPYHYGVGAALAALLPGEDILCLPQPSAVSLACARLGWPLAEVAVLSACGRPLAALRPLLQPGARIVLLSADRHTPPAAAALLCRHGFGGSRLHLLEALGGPRARHRVLAAEAPLPDDIDPLNLLAIEVASGPGAAVMPLASGLADGFFAHDGQFSRQEARALALAALAPRRGEVLWDIGCGAGSVAIEWALRHPANRAFGIEARADRAARAAANAEALGAVQARISVGHAPEALADLPPPDAVFIGGGGHDPAVLAASWAALAPGGRLVAHAVTVETEAVLLAARAPLGATLTRIAVQRLEPVGGLHGWRPAMPLTQFLAVKPYD